MPLGPTCHSWSRKGRATAGDDAINADTRGYRDLVARSVQGETRPRTGEACFVVDCGALSKTSSSNGDRLLGLL